jgi:hypothetical protein
MQLVRLVCPHIREDNHLPILFGMGDELCSTIDKHCNETDYVSHVLLFICIDKSYHLIYKRYVFRIFYKKKWPDSSEQFYCIN